MASGIPMLGAATLAAALLALSAQAKTYALVVGIDDYAHFPSLAGAVNDARDLALTLRGRGVEVTLRLDAEVTRAQVMEDWARIARAVRPGDSIVFTYAGHGVQMSEALPGDETDGLDEVFILQSFGLEGQGLAERIRDNDIAAMLGQIPAGVPVLLVADSCHSGTMTRAVDPRGHLGRSRYVEVGRPKGPDPLAGPEARTRGVEPGELPNVIFAHAARDDQETPEVEIDGIYRGALSWSVARAIERQTGQQGLTLDDFRDFVVEQVRALSGARQTPGVQFSRALDSVTAGQGVGALLTPVAGPPALPPPPVGELVLAPPPTLFVRGSDRSRTASLGEVELVATEEKARLLWDQDRAELVDRATADVIAEAPGFADVARAVLKWRSVQPLLRWVPQRPLEFRVEPGDGRHRLGEEVWITVRQPGPEFRYLTVVNLASTGEVQFVYPAAGHVRDGLDRFAPGEKSRRLGPAPVTAPTGADHVLALASAHRLDDLHAGLADLHARVAPERLLELIERHAGNADEVRIGLLPLFTAR
jgi:hypothetical protein